MITIADVEIRVRCERQLQSKCGRFRPDSFTGEERMGSDELQRPLAVKHPQCAIVSTSRTSARSGYIAEQ
jgi:hypothetical protein